MKYRIATTLAGLCIGGTVDAAHPAKLKAGQPVTFEGRIKGELDLSGGAVVGKFLIVVSNEAHGVQVLKETGDREYMVVGFIELAEKGTDLDLEAVAAEGNIVYATGSHGRSRKIGSKDGPGGGIGKVEVMPTRDRVFRFTLSGEGTTDKVDVVSLRRILGSDTVLKAFVPMASKENGIDIEGLAVKEGKLFFGFRGPVLRDNWCPVLVAEFDKIEETAEVRYVQLGGRGIRDLAAVKEGFLILAGPSSDAHLSFQIYQWDGASGLPQRDRGDGAALLDTVPSAPKHRSEGLIVAKESDKGIELLVLHDGVAGGNPTKYVLEWKK